VRYAAGFDMCGEGALNVWERGPLFILCRHHWKEHGHSAPREEFILGMDLEQGCLQLVLEILHL
jgi:hypothetical protein